MKAIWKDTVLAESNETIVVEGNNYFPPKSLKAEHLARSETLYTCPWKGKAQYWDVVVNGEKLKDGAWSYPKPLPAAKEIAQYIAFDKDVEIQE